MKPLPYQKEDVRAIECPFKGRVLLAHDMGLGKTPMVYWWFRRNRSRASPVIIICPSSVKPQWLSWAKEFNVTAIVLEGRTTRKLEPSEFYIINYDILTYWKKQLKQLDYKTVVLDECHYVANWNKRTRVCQSLCYNADHVLALSGTPMLNKSVEMFYTLNMIRPDVFESKLEFMDTYSNWEMTRYGRKYSGVRNGKKLNQLLLDTCMIRRKKTEVLDQLPDKVRRVVPLEVSNWQEYQQATSNFLGWLRGKNRGKAERAKRSLAMARVGYLLRLTARLKIRAAVEWVDRLLEEKEKVLLFANHRKALDVFQKRCSVASVRVDGGVKGKKREEAIEEFVHGKTRLLVGNTRALGVGVDRLQRVCQDAVFFELPWHPSALTQAEDRLWRLGVSKDVWCWYLIAYRTIEEKLCEVLRLKQEDMNAVIDGKEDVSDLDILDMLMTELERGELTR